MDKLTSFVELVRCGEGKHPVDLAGVVINGVSEWEKIEKVNGDSEDGDTDEIKRVPCMEFDFGPYLGEVENYPYIDGACVRVEYCPDDLNDAAHRKLSLAMANRDKITIIGEYTPSFDSGKYLGRIETKIVIPPKNGKS